MQGKVPYIGATTVTLTSTNLSGTLTASNNAGQVSFTNLKYTKAGVFTLTATIPATKTAAAVTSTLQVSPRSSLITLKADDTTYSTIRNSMYNYFKLNGGMSLLLRLSFHDAGTYSKSDGSGGSHASIRFPKEMNYEANKGLSKAMEIINQFKVSFPAVSYADLIQIGGYVAVEYAGGPAIKFKFGRVDALTDAECLPAGRLPDANSDAAGLQNTFYKLGFNDEEIVTLSGAHTIGSAHTQNSGFNGPWTMDPKVFNNHYFTELNATTQNTNVLRMPSDSTLKSISSMNTWVQNFAKDQTLFFTKYGAVQKKLSELGYQ